MKSLKGTRTEKNLLASFAGESQARNRYTFAADVAKKEGFEQIAAVFTETAEQERMHAKRFFRFLEGGDLEITATYPAGVIGTTLENLKAAALGENHEYTVLYPEAAKIADEEGFPEIAAQFRSISTAEKHHEERFAALAKNIEEGVVFKREEKKVWACRKCGFIVETFEPPAKCPACGHGQGYFELQAKNW